MTAPKRGLGSLARAASWRTDIERITHTEASEIRSVPPERIDPAPWQPRRSFDEAALAELSESIRERGVLQPLLVREKSGGRFELLAGERRLRAARLIPLTAVPVRVLSVSDLEARLITRAENRDREDLSPWEDACELAGIRDLARAEGRGVSVRELAAAEEEAVGSVSEKLRIADRLTPEVWTQALGSRTPEEIARIQGQISYRSLRRASQAGTPEERAARLYDAVHRRRREEPRRSTVERERPPVEHETKHFTSRTLHGGGRMFEIRTPGQINRVEAREILRALEPTLTLLRDRAGLHTLVMEHDV